MNFTYLYKFWSVIIIEFHPAWTNWSTVEIVVHVVLSFETWNKAPFIYYEAIFHVGLGKYRILVNCKPNCEPISIPNSHEAEAEAEDGYVEWSESNALSHPIVSPQVVFELKSIVLFLIILNVDYVIGVKSLGMLKYASLSVLEAN